MGQSNDVSTIPTTKQNECIVVHEFKYNYKKAK